jgi:hypothetical protein
MKAYWGSGGITRRILDLRIFSGIALSYGLDDRVFESQYGLGIFLLLTTAS